MNTLKVWNKDLPKAVLILDSRSGALLLLAGQINRPFQSSVSPRCKMSWLD